MSTVYFYVWIEILGADLGGYRRTVKLASLVLVPISSQY